MVRHQPAPYLFSRCFNYSNTMWKRKQCYFDLVLFFGVIFYYYNFSLSIKCNKNFFFQKNQWLPMIIKIIMINCFGYNHAVQIWGSASSGSHSVLVYIPPLSCICLCFSKNKETQNSRLHVFKHRDKFGLFGPPSTITHTWLTACTSWRGTTCNLRDSCTFCLWWIIKKNSSYPRNGVMESFSFYNSGILWNWKPAHAVPECLSVQPKVLYYSAFPCTFSLFVLALLLWPFSKIFTSEMLNKQLQFFAFQVILIYSFTTCTSNSAHTVFWRASDFNHQRNNIISYQNHATNHREHRFTVQRLSWRGLSLNASRSIVIVIFNMWKKYTKDSS